MLAAQVLSQQLPGFGGEGAQLTVMCQVAPLVTLQALLGQKALVAGGALHQAVFGLSVALQCDLAATCVVTLLAWETAWELVHALAVVSECTL